MAHPWRTRLLRLRYQVQIRHLWKGKNSAKWTPPFEVKRKKLCLDVTPSTVFWAYEICTSTMFNKRVALFMAYSRCGDDNFFLQIIFSFLIFCPQRESLPLCSELYIITVHIDTAQHYDHCGRCQIRTWDLSVSSLVNFKWATTSGSGQFGTGSMTLSGKDESKRKI